MGADQFIVKSWGTSPHKAFRSARIEARWEHGHSGYTGSIAEKTSFKMVPLMPDQDPWELAESLLDDEDHWIDDKWGPAGCIELPGMMEINGKTRFSYLFFGWASS